MQGCVFDIKHFAINDGPGIRQTIFLKGCPLSCKWCHNPESQSTAPFNYITYKSFNGKNIKHSNSCGKYYSSTDLLDIILKDELFYKTSNGGVTFSGGEPFYQAKFLIEMLRLCKSKDINTCIDTCGHANLNDIKNALPYSDLFLFDLKLLSPRFDKKYTGVKSSTIINNLLFLDSIKANCVIRHPFIQNLSNNTENLIHLHNTLKKIKHIKSLEILPYHNLAKNKLNKYSIQHPMETFAYPKSKDLIDFANGIEQLGFNVKIKN